MLCRCSRKAPLGQAGQWLSSTMMVTKPGAELLALNTKAIAVPTKARQKLSLQHQHLLVSSVSPRLNPGNSVCPKTQVSLPLALEVMLGGDVFTCSVS